MSREIRTVGIVGLGTVGARVAEVFARAGLDVVAVDVRPAATVTGGGRIAAALSDDAAAVSRVRIGDGLDDLATADLVVEAVDEQSELKREVLAKIDSVVDADAVLATSTSALGVTGLAVTTQNPSRVIGLHVSAGAMVEVARTVLTPQPVVDGVVAALAAAGLTPLVVADRPGLIVQALLLPYLNQAVGMLEGGYAGRDDIDAAMRFGCGLPAGPLALVDAIGVDVAYDILDGFHRASGDHRHAPSPVLRQMVISGLLGVKSGRGFYTYDAPGSATVVADEPGAAGAGPKPRVVQKVGVIGSGTMATGIVEVFAKAGYQVTFVARGEDKVARVLAAVTRSLDKAVSKGKLEQSAREDALGRITGATSHDALGDVDLVVEAIVEDLAVKRALFADLDRICRPGAVLATTTSSLPVAECAAVTSRPADVIGMHFFNPAPVMRLVEIVSTVGTAPDVVATVEALCRSVRKHPVRCGDRAGFIVNALLFPYLNDAVSMLASHYASADDIDAAVTGALGYPMGPFALLDVVGNDVSLAIQQTLFAEFREPGFAPAPLLEQVVEAGYLGRKTGRGFRDYC